MAKYERYVGEQAGGGQAETGRARSVTVRESVAAEVCKCVSPSHARIARMELRKSAGAANTSRT